MWSTNASPIVFRYAEVLLSYAEAENELNGPSADVYAKINLVRQRVGMPAVDQTKYGTKDKLRELIRRERSVDSLVKVSVVLISFAGRVRTAR